MTDSQAPDEEQANGTSPSADNQHHPLDSMNNTTADKFIVLSFLDLQLERIGALQDEVIEACRESGPQSSQVGQSLRYYAQALRDYETLTLNAIPIIPIGACFVGSMGLDGQERRDPDPNNLQTAKLALEILPIFEEYSGFLGRLGYSNVEQFLTRKLESLYEQVSKKTGPSGKVNAIQDVCGELGFRELDRQGRVLRAEKQAFLQRAFMGVFGGIALICPVLVMVLYPSQNTNLITMSVATILFALLTANYASDGTGQDVLAATAAYTAVLVVFFGTSGSSA